ncbi:MFS transporter [Aureobasidium pullulans]|uniref:MFS transporter n=2 Tax=Aureobasidium pullulans TaxID=5580 RepID=A0A4V4II50_AURPU|nr:MFS transporter [Aureobasidium pullulans]TIA52940.1 MFS transporter [Aureobasidium pullulans]
MAAHNEDSLLANWKCMIAVIIVSMSPFQYGIDYGLIGGIQAMVGFLQVYGYEDPSLPLGWNLTATRQQLISSLMVLGAVIASGCAGPIAWQLGRKTCLWAACALLSVGNIIMMATTHIGALYAGRFILGLGNGLLMTFSQLYIQEVTPARYRGLALASFQFFTSIGTLIGTIVDNFTAKREGRSAYLIPLGLIYVVPVVICVGLIFIPESPRWLLEHDQTDKARKALAWLRPHPERVEEELSAIQAGIDQEKSLKASVSVWDMFTDPVDRRRTILSVAAINTQAASGAMFIIAYGTYFFEMAGVGNSFQNSCILTSVGVIAIILNTCIITRFGRRRLFLITGLLLCGFMQLIIAVVYTTKPGSPAASKVIVALSILYMFSYNGLIATYAWLSGGEIPSQRLRSYTFGLAASIGFIGAWLATFTAPYFINPSALNWGPRYGYIWFPSCMVAAVFIYFFLPEIKDRTLEEISEMFEAGLPARKFKGYKCVGAAAVVAAEKKEKGDEIEVSTQEVVWRDPKAASESAAVVG